VTTLVQARDLASEKLDGALSLVVARRAGDVAAAGLDAHKLNLDESAVARFRAFVRTAVDDLEARTAIAYQADAELSGKEAFVIDDHETMTELADLVDLSTASIDLPVIAPSQLDTSIQLYAVVVGNDDRIVFVRRVDPVVHHKAGRFLAIGSERLKEVTEPTFTFSSRFDLILAPGWAIVLNQSAFELLFRDIGLVERHIDEWVSGITEHIAMEPASVHALRDAATRDSRMWRRLREIKRRGHLSSVSLKQVRAYAKRVGIDPDSVVKDKQLVFDPTERFSFLHLLNEDLYQGELTDTTFEAQRKAAT